MICQQFARRVQIVYFKHFKYKFNNLVFCSEKASPIYLLGYGKFDDSATIEEADSSNEVFWIE
jgi:hypothetical protein